jgi:hypothetical protein
MNNGQAGDLQKNGLNLPKESAMRRKVLKPKSLEPWFTNH